MATDEQVLSHTSIIDEGGQGSAVMGRPQRGDYCRFMFAANGSRPLADRAFVAPALRGQGVAGDLVSHAIAAVDGPIWLFCDPQLQGFYEKLGFSLDVELPHALHERLVRYQRNKAMIAMGLTPWCADPDQETAPQ